MMGDRPGNAAAGLASKALHAEFWVVAELEDFRENPTLELRERNERLRAAR